MTFSEWLKYSYITQAIEFAVIGLLLFGVKQWRKKHPMKTPEFPLNRCSVPSCRLGSGHVMPCWDGTPDPNYKERTRTDAKP